MTLHVAGLAGGTGTSVAVRAVVGVVLPAAEGRRGATTLLGRRLALVEEPLRFLLCCEEGHRGQRRPWPGNLALAPSGGGVGLTERLLLDDLGKLHKNAEFFGSRTKPMADEDGHLMKGIRVASLLDIPCRCALSENRPNKQGDQAAKISPFISSYSF